MADYRHGTVSHIHYASATHIKGPNLLIKGENKKIKTKGPTSSISFVGHDGENAKIKSA